MPAETLLQKQQRFVALTGKLIAWAYAHGYTMTTAEGERTKDQAAIYAAQGKGSAKSLHLIRLAHDWNIFKDGKWLTSGNDFKDLGEYWESLGGTWGGRFNDGNHFSLEHDGRK